MIFYYTLDRSRQLLIQLNAKQYKFTCFIANNYIKQNYKSALVKKKSILSYVWPLYNKVCIKVYM